MMLNSTTTPRSRLVSRRPSKVTDLELNTNPLLENALNLYSNPLDRSCNPMLGEIDANLRLIKDFCLPLGGHNFNVRGLYGRTTLHKAARKGYEAVAEYLLLHGADIYAQDDEGITPLDEANRSGNPNLATLMLEKQGPKEILATPFREEEHMITKDGVLKMAFALLNVGIELCQAILSQEKPRYRRLGVALALACLMVSVFEMVYEARRDGVEWKKRGGCYWLYYPGRNGGVFGRFMLWFGLVSSFVQLCLNLVSLGIKRAVVKFDYMGLLLSVLYLMARFGCRERSMRGVMTCGEHGECEVEGRVEQGRWVLECIHCRMGKLV